MAKETPIFDSLKPELREDVLTVVSDQIKNTEAGTGKNVPNDKINGLVEAKAMVARDNPKKIKEDAAEIRKDEDQKLASQLEGIASRTKVAKLMQDNPKLAQEVQENFDKATKQPEPQVSEGEKGQDTGRKLPNGRGGRH